jgi:pilus assembly protein CpaE
MVAAVRKPDSVVVVDLDLQFGQVATHLNLPPRQTLSDVIRDQQALLEPELLRTYTTRHDSGLHALAASSIPTEGELVTAEHVTSLLRTLPGTFDTVIVDGGSTFDDRTRAAFEASELVVFPVYAEIAALRALHALLEHLTGSAIVGGKSLFVLNEVFAKHVLKPPDIERAIGTTLTAQLPYDPFLYLQAVDHGSPVVRGAPRSAPAEALTKLADTVFGVDGAVPAAAPAGEDRRGRRFGLLRRQP